MEAHMKEFHEERRSGIGGSDVAAILGLPNPGGRTPLQVWSEKTGRAESKPDAPLLRRGRKLEPVTRSEYEEETGHRVIALDRDSGQDFFRHPTIPYLVVHLDGKIEAAEKDGLGAFEGKAANVLRLNAWDDEAPLSAQLQCQHGMSVAGLKWGVVAGLIGGLEFRFQELDRNDELLAAVQEKLAAFWEHVTSDTPPDPVAADVKVIGRIFRAIEGKSVDLDDEALAWDLDRLQASGEIKRWQTIKDEAEARLKFAIGEAEIGKLSSGASYSFKQFARKDYVVAATRYRQLARQKAR